MANKKKGLVEIELDKKRTLKFNYNAFCELEDALGKPFSELEDVTKFKMKDLRAVLWAGLIHEDSDLTLQKVGDLIDEAESLQHVSEKIGEAVQASLGNKKQAEGK